LPESDISNISSLPFPIHKNKDIVEITTSDVNHTIEELMAHDITLAHLQIRSRNLDDLFLELTGRELRS